MPFQPASSLTNRTFLGLIVAQFLAGFNDQAIHASAMFYAIHQGILTEAQAITLMPILFYAPWAIFCTLAGFCADRYSKTRVLQIWKISEVIISLVMLAGFMLGAASGAPLGAWMVLSTVFLMGTHAAFFAPAKYGIMPEILQPHILSRGTGILESTTFLAAILGTVAGGYLSHAFRHEENIIGWILLGLSLVGVVFSLMIAYLPAASPAKVLRLFKPLVENLGTLMRSRPLALSVVGIAFFIFMVSYMRAAMYMHGESRNPPWSESRTSLVVACVALGVGLGSPLAGYLSGGKIELGLVPLGCLGMMGAAVLAAASINVDAALIVALIIIGFFSGFYMVPFYTLLQQRAPKQSKGELIATSNFINVVGAIAASVLFFLLVKGVQVTGLTPKIMPRDTVAGVLVHLEREEIHPAGAGNARKPHFGKTKEIIIEPDDKRPPIAFRVRPKISFAGDVVDFILQVGEQLMEEEQGFEEDLLEMPAGMKKGDHVIVSEYAIDGVQRYRLRHADEPLKPVYDYRGLPRFLFLGAALMTLIILVLLVRKLPDFFVRMVFWMRSLGRFRLRAVGMEHLPTSGPVILATNCDRLESSLQVVSATDRSTLFVLWENPQGKERAPFLRSLAQRVSVVEISHAGSDTWHEAHRQAKKALGQGNLLALTADGHASAEIEDLIQDLRQTTGAPILPVFCGPVDSGRKPRVRVVFGELMPEGASLEAIRHEIRLLGDKIRRHDVAALPIH